MPTPLLHQVLNQFRLDFLTHFGYAEGLQAHSFAPLAELIQQFVASGGRI